ncbi:MAG: AMP-binding protein [Pirellulales bacterium]
MNAMAPTGELERQRLAGLDRPALARYQLQRLNELLETILPHNGFYQHKLGRRRRLESLRDLADLPLTTKDELAEVNSATGLPANLTFPPERYVRFHQTSGTRGRPMAVLDTADDWQWWIDTWQYVLDAAGVAASDRVMMAFSFGPFIGFWSAYDAVAARGGLVIPGGGMSTLARLELMRTCHATAVFCTPTYALRMAEVAAEHGINLASSKVRVLVVAGEPGGSAPAIRQRIEAAWGARLIDHSGATEVGPWGFADTTGQGLHIIESEFLAEFISVESGRLAIDGELSHLILTTLGRAGCPVIRYRTGDLVRPRWAREGDCRFVYLEGGVLGRADDMLVVRGVNIFPSSIDQILHSFPEVVEYRMTARKRGAMDELVVEVEDRLGQPQRIVEALELRLGLRVEVSVVPPGSLPRYEGKSKRFVDERR